MLTHSLTLVNRFASGGTKVVAVGWKREGVCSWWKIQVPRVGWGGEGGKVALGGDVLERIWEGEGEGGGFACKVSRINQLGTLSRGKWICCGENRSLY